MIMKPHQNKQQREKDTPAITRKERDKKLWVKEWQWRSKKDYLTYPKYWGDRGPFNQEWHLEVYGKFKSSDGVLDSIKHDLRSRFSKRYIMGRNWRARNTVTNEIVEFTDIENYYE